jgi:threonine synthase
VERAERVSLGEGWTPLVEVPWCAGSRVLFKLEWFNPTSSFKDRGVSVMVSHLKAQGATRVLEDSSGNGGSAVAAYAAAAGIRAKIIVPAATSAAKILQARAYGAEIELVGGTRDEVSDEAIRQSASIPYASHNWHPMFLQGTKLIAYEIWEDLGFTAPDAVVLPTGAGSLVLGCATGFAELQRAGEIARVPRILVSQPARCSPLVEALTAGRDAVEPRTWEPTIAEGTAIARPVRDREVLAAVRDSGGSATAVREEDLRAATLALAATGLYVEPTCGQVVPALEQFAREGHVSAGDSVVLVLTGSGLKASDAMARLLAEERGAGAESG